MAFNIGIEKKVSWPTAAKIAYTGRLELSLLIKTRFPRRINITYKSKDNKSNNPWVDNSAGLKSDIKAAKAIHGIAIFITKAFITSFPFSPMMFFLLKKNPRNKNTIVDKIAPMKF